jgi:hypothetical protein
MKTGAWSGRGISTSSKISLAEIGPPFTGTDPVAGTTTLQFRLDGNDSARMEALRETRRAMIREEWTRGLEAGEPSLAEAMFSIHGVFWDVPLGERQRCREKLESLIERANRRLEQAPSQHVLAPGLHD